MTYDIKEHAIEMIMQTYHISREEALELCQKDNKIKYDTLKNFSEVIGFNLDNVLSRINCLEKLYQIKI